MPASTPGRVNWTSKNVAQIKPLVFILALYPVFRWVWLGFTDGLSANPAEFLIRSSGIWALVALLLTLTITPLRRIFQQPALVRLRRMLGLFAFFYTCLHLLGWAFWERDWSLASMWDDIVQRTFILIGMIAFVPMVALACTSTRGWMHRMGHHWQSLHRSIYLIAALSVWHFWLVRAGKNDFFDPYVYGVVLAVLLLVRVWFFVRRRTS
ncbi:sulfoxide reductase heme-binding subunit YedZ [Candidimonas sp. SYP-B2681]|uniref:sulfite oxidase heme-binding subunit YedZ n=1 Tax=Candidimonas sp. SYP-B2681 TaxID=2497686 RepID=UPI000F85EB0E|nr:protein-methionine-sulfoxide reductase heme-binding subunit MsrQ [Candidimonas sp. SYP-B2681]RTZ42487.1 sulfoxide reductase heme-binding subunit YedZ [Candidimonas sp. SYP-B2681]